MASNNRMDLLDEARAAVLVQRVRALSHEALPAASALEMATLGGARALGLAERIGSLEPGKDADLAAWMLPPGASADGDPVAAAVFALGGAPARMVAVRGALRVWDWHLAHDDGGLHDRVAETARALAAHLAAPRPTPA